jgi:L-lactate utilization protein LutC
VPWWVWIWSPARNEQLGDAEVEQLTVPPPIATRNTLSAESRDALVVGATSADAMSSVISTASRSGAPRAAATVALAGEHVHHQ